MTMYHYDISGDHPFNDESGAQHLNDSSAWRDAVKLIRDVEDHLGPNGLWILKVRDGNRLVFSIEVKATAGNEYRQQN